MKYKIFIILFILLLPAANSALAEQSRYRVEILVLRHLQAEAEPDEVVRLRDYSGAVDFLSPTEDEEEPPDAAEPAGDEKGPASEPDSAERTDSPEGQADAEASQEEPADPEPVHVEEMSEVMQEAWRRLRLSGPFRPEQYLAWEQSGEPPFPALRVHDLDILLVDDPWADLRLEQGAEEEPSPAYSDTAGPQTMEEATEPDLPPPTIYYRLDGSVTLRRTRFLHLDLDLELRRPVYAQTALRAQPADPPAEGTPALPAPDAFLVHRLQQSRQVKTAKMNYFDHPVLGVLAYVESIEIETESENRGNGPSETGPGDSASR